MLGKAQYLIVRYYNKHNNELICLILGKSINYCIFSGSLYPFKQDIDFALVFNKAEIEFSKRRVF